MEALGGLPAQTAVAPPAPLTPVVVTPSVLPSAGATDVAATAQVTAEVVTTRMPTASVQASAVPTVVIPQLPTKSPEELWREQQQSREVFAESRLYRTTGSNLWWYDPINNQFVVLGFINGDITVQAEFVLAATGEPGLEIPYRINQSYGLTALSPAILERLAAAGYTEWVETYVLQDDAVIPR